MFRLFLPLMAAPLILALDLGTTAAKAALFDLGGRCVALFRRRLPLRFLPGGGVEQEPERFIQAARGLISSAAGELPASVPLLCAGVACQRASVVFWDRRSGRARGPAVSWMDRRAAPLVGILSGSARRVERRSGLRLSPHYGGPHIAWRLSSDARLARAVREGDVAAGPVASFVLARIARGSPFACDPTLAQRTILFDPWRSRWDRSLCELFDVPSACLPQVQPSIADWGEIAVGSRRVPVRAVAGDQQAAAAAFDLDGPQGSVLVHYGTGAFALWPWKRERIRPAGLLLSARADERGQFYVEGTVNAAGAALDAVGRWIGRARLAGILRRGGAIEPIRRPSQAPLLVPAFAGLGAPHWDPRARPLLSGVDGAAGPEELVEAALMGIAHRVADILDAGSETLPRKAHLVLSGPLALLPPLRRIQADLAGRPVRLARETEATLRGVARIASRAASDRQVPPAPAGRAIAPRLSARGRAELREEWRRALKAARMQFR